MPATTRYEPKHRALKERTTKHWKRLAALGATVPTALGTVVTLSAPATAAEQRESKIQEALAIARDQKGDAYEYGADGPHQFDCSGLMHFAFENAGIAMPRSSDEQAAKGEQIPRSQLQPGDLIAFHDGGDVYHVAMYTGHTDSGATRIVEAANEDTGVRSGAVWDDSWYAVSMR
jgi:cell wall-associated NlpC family hydrolase